MITTELIDCTHLKKGSKIDVETKSRHYLIECVNGNSVRISGHPDLCPEPVSAWLQGSFDAEGTFEPGMVGRGRRLMFLLDRRPVTTSRILSVHVDQVAESLSGTPSGVHSSSGIQ